MFKSLFLMIGTQWSPFLMVESPLQTWEVQELRHRRHAEDPGDGVAVDLERAVLGDPGMRNRGQSWLIMVNG